MEALIEKTLIEKTLIDEGTLISALIGALADKGHCERRTTIRAVPGSRAGAGAACCRLLSFLGLTPASG